MSFITDLGADLGDVTKLGGEVQNIMKTGVTVHTDDKITLGAIPKSMYYIAGFVLIGIGALWYFFKK